MLQSTLATELRATADRLDAEVAALEGMSEESLGWTPPDGGWSVGQVLEHLCLAHDSYAERVRALVARGEPVAPPAAEWKPTLIGGMLVRSFRSPRRLPAPRIYRVGPLTRPRVTAELRARQRDLDVLLAAAAPLHWVRLHTSSPVSSLVRVNLGDCFRILVEHAARHMHQIARVRAAAGHSPA